jgi:mono/diheme cytochrome c family protein
MNSKIRSTYVCLLLSCLISACTSEPQSNIVSTPTKETPTVSTPVTPAKVDSSASAPNDPALAVGEKLYTENCKVCHNLNTVTLIGPGLAGINERRPQEWLVPWIKNSQKVIASGDKYAVELFNKFNKVPMPNYDFSDEEIKSLLAYIAKNEQR